MPMVKAMAAAEVFICLTIAMAMVISMDIYTYISEEGIRVGN